jgi:hypothetical protein
MRAIRNLCVLLLLTAAAPPAFADDILEAIGEARKAYSAGNLGAAKEALDLASQLIGQKNAEAFARLLPAARAGWKAEEPQISAVGAVTFGGSTASRVYTNAKGDHVEVQITGDSAMLAQFASLLASPQLAGAMGKVIKIGQERAIQNNDGDIHIVVARKFLVTVSGSAAAADKMAYANAVDLAKLAKM